MTSKLDFAARLSLVCGLVLTASLASAADDKKEERKPIAIADVKHDGAVDFEKEVLPILIKKCQACHNATDAESDLVLETPQSILKGGYEGPSVVAGKSAESLLLKLAAHQQGPVMPPADNNRGAKNLTSEELGLVKLWIDQGAKGEVTGLAGAPKWQPLPQGVNPVYAVAISPDGQFVAAGRANQIFLYHAPSKRELGRLTDPAMLKSGAYDKPGVAHLDLVQSLAFSPDNQWLASGGYRTVKLWHRDANAKIADLPALAEPAVSLAVSADGQWAAFGQQSGKIQLYDLAARKPIRTLEGHTAAVSGVVFSQDGSKLVSGSADKTFRVWNVADGKLIDEPVETPAPIGAVALVTADSQVATGGEDKILRIWNLPGGEAAEAAKKAAIEAAKKASEEKKEEVKPEPTKAIAELPGHGGAITSLAAILPAGTELVSGSQDATVRIWNVAGKNATRTMSHGGPVVSVAVRSDGKRIASASSNNIAKLWDATNGQQVAELRGDLKTKLNVEEVTRIVALAKSKIDDTKKDLDEAGKRKTAEEDNFKKTEETLKTAQEDAKKKIEAEKKPVADKLAADKKLADAMAALPKAEADQKTADEAAKKAAEAATAAAAAATKAAADVNTVNAEVAKAVADVNTATAELTKAQTALTAATKTATDADNAAKAAADKAKADQDAAKKAQDAAKAAQDAANVAQEAAKKEPENKALADAAKKADDAAKAADAAAKAAEATAKAADDAAKKAAEVAKTAATAKTAAEKVVADADAKKKTLDAAKVVADKKKADADKAKTTADAAKVAADKAKVDADTAKKTADTAFTAATNAVKTAEAEVKKLDPIATKATDEKNAAERALKAAERGVARSKEAVEKATAEVPMIEALVKQAEDAHKQREADLETAKKAVTDSEKPLRGVAFSIDGSTLATVGDDQMVHTWDSETGAAIDSFAGQGAAIGVVGFTAEGDVLAAADNKTAMLWDADAEWKLARTIGSADASDVFVDRVTALSFSPDSKLLATGGGEPSRSGELKIFNIADGALVREIPEAHSDTIFSLEFSPSGEHLASSGADRFVKTFEVATGKFVKSFEGHTHHVLGVSWSADGKMLASSGADNVIKTWNFKTGDQIRTITGFNKEVTAVRFVSITPNVVASCGDKTVSMKRADNGGNVRGYAGGADFMYCVGVSADGKVIVAGGQDSTVRLWLEPGTVFATFAPPVIEQTASTDAGK